MEQITKILLIHKPSDHSGELKSFPNAQIFVNEDELAADDWKCPRCKQGKEKFNKA